MAKMGARSHPALALLVLAAPLGLVVGAPASAGADTVTAPTIRAAAQHGTLVTACPKPQPPGPVPPSPEAGTETEGAMPTPTVNFDGTSSISGLPEPESEFPADPSGAPGPDDYVQTTNFSYTIFRKDGSVRCGPWSTNTFWQSLGSPCNEFVSDAVVLSDRDAGRWFVSRFGIAGLDSEEEDPPAVASSDHCFAISDTSDPTGSWQLYQFDISRQYFADYPKFGIWPDAYYMTANPNKIFSRTGVIAVAFDRAAMLAGRADAKMVEFLVPAEGRKFGMLPADRDGPAPPPRGSPGIFVQPRDTDLGFAPPDSLGIWSFHVDWFNPAASTFTMTGLETAAFDSNVCGGSQECIPQPGTNQTVDSLTYGYLIVPGGLPQLR